MSSQTQSQHAAHGQYPQILHNAALLGLVACPILALLPPRKFDIYTIGLIGCTAYSANFLTLEKTGRSIQELMPRSRREESRITKLGIQNPRSESVAAAVTTELEKTKSSREAWKTQREKEIQDDLDAGKGFADMIIDQVWEVWNWGKKKDDESDEK
ncbi:hypothetical protein M433DRAFT_106647 [Acidomyces richmondensis BFW]|nr:MAG: hypothetical protein FE78DRAFT_167846 [Acidomyces sp. 'richmondensis']KYG46264.1 hypothetical protein M433DRAFT_106647 [Acidomyces richmondensis BFW]